MLDAILEQDPTAGSPAKPSSPRVWRSSPVKSRQPLRSITSRSFAIRSRRSAITTRRIGYDANTCSVIDAIGTQSPDIAQGVDTGGAGDQGLMFGFACNETPELMPMPIQMAHNLTRKLSEVRRERRNSLSCVPTANRRSRSSIATDVRFVSKRSLSRRRPLTSTSNTIRKDVMEKVIKPTIPAGPARRQYQVSHQPDRPFCGRRPDGRRRRDRTKDHRRHLRRLCAARRRCFLG